MTYDSRPDTYQHMDRVRELVLGVAVDLIERARVHDASKLVSPEVETFDQITERLAGTEYGSQEYIDTLREFRPGIEHHQMSNDHHPEFHGEDRVHAMNLVQMIEMLCDWKAAGERHDDGGDIMKSIEIGQQRHGYSDEVKRILVTTAEYLGFV
jgi:hypothetical protein